MAPLSPIASFLKWREHESHCRGQHQSPINIDSNDVISANYPEFVFHNYDLVFPERLVNTGHTGRERLTSLSYSIIFVCLFFKSDAIWNFTRQLN